MKVMLGVDNRSCEWIFSVSRFHIISRNIPSDCLERATGGFLPVAIAAVLARST